MSNVFVDKNKIDILANAISTKSGESLTLTLDEMVEAVDGIDTGGITPTGNIDITQAGTTDVTNYATATVASGSVTGPTSNFTASSYGTGSYNGNLQVTTSNVPTTPTVSAGYVSSATSSSRKVTVQTQIPYNPSITVSGDTVTIPKGYYNSNSTKTVASGSLGVPTNSFSKDSTYWTVTKNFTNLTPGWFSNLSDITTNVPLEDKTVTPSTSSQTVTPTGDTYYLNSVTVDAMPSGTAGTPTATKGTVSNHSVSVTPSVTNTAGYISGGTKTGSAVTVSASELASGNKEITSNGTNIDVVGYSTVSVNVSGGGGSSVQIGTGFGTAGTPNTSTLTFTNLAGEPTSYAVFYGGTINTSSTVTVAGLAYDGTNIHGQGITNTNNAQVSYLDDTYFTASYSSGTLTITASNCVFSTAYPYGIFYSYGGSSTNIGTENVQVGSGATSITFTGLTDEPEYWSCIFKSNFSTSSGYQRVIEVVCDGTNIYGLEMDSSAKYSDTHWSYTYNNGSLTITSQGTNAGGYFHQPGYYQLTYAVSGDQSLQTKTVTPTTSTQNVEADQGYTALKKVVVNPIPSSYVQPTATQGATTYRASTTQQTIASGTYLSGTQTIAPVSQTNLTAENIKSGTTISISNGQSNIWSVTGTYSGGGGGGGATIDVKTITPSSNVTSLSFDVSGKPIMFVVQMNKNNSYINGSSTRYITSAANNGETVYTTALYKSGSTGREYTYNTSSWSYSNGTLTITSGGGSTAGYFTTSQYRLIYAY